MPQLLRLHKILLLAAACILLPITSSAATITVCASGCTYNNTQLQTAIDAANPGDIILLQENIVYTSTDTTYGFKLRMKTCAAGDDTCYITIRTGVDASGVTLAESYFPATNIRISPSYASHLAKIKVPANNVPAMRTVLPAQTGSGCAAAPCLGNYWKLWRLEFQNNTWGGNAELMLGSNDVSTDVPGNDTQNTEAEVPHHFILDQLYVHGDPIHGGIRGINIAARYVTLKNSYISDFKGAGRDSQAVAVINTIGDITLTNNYLEGAAENFMSGGDNPRMTYSTTVTAGTTTSATLASSTDLHVGQGISILVGAVKQRTVIQTKAGNDVTFSPALTGSPDIPGAVLYSNVPKNFVVEKNWMTKPASWKNPIVGTPTSVTANGAITGGTLAAGTYYYKVVARTIVNEGNYARSTASSETSGVVASGSTGSVVVSWGAVANADEYRVYGRSSGGENIYFTVAAPTTTFTDTGAAGTAGAVPTTNGTTWVVKNVFELKNADTVTANGNVFEYDWCCGQNGYIVLFTVINQNGGGDSTVVANVTFTNNIVRHGPGSFNITGTDADGYFSQLAHDFLIQNNLIYDINGTTWGGWTHALLFTTGSTPIPNGADNVTINHNTFDNTADSMSMAFDLYKAGSQRTLTNYKFNNNIFKHDTYGIRSSGASGFGIEGNTAWSDAVDGTWEFKNNVLAGYSASLYTFGSGNFFPTNATLEGYYTSYVGNDFKLASGPYINAGTDGTDIGANITTLTALTNIALSGDNSGGAPPVVPPVITTASPLASGSVGVAYSQALAATDGTTPYTWSVSIGSLPTGLTLNSSTGTISGTPVASGSSTFTIQVMDSGSRTGSKEFNISVQDIVFPAPRPDKIYFDEGVFFRRAVCPTDATIDPVRQGDLCYDLTANLLKVATATSPAIVWSPVVSGAVAPQSILMISDTANFTWTLSANATPPRGAAYSMSSDRYVDLTGLTQCRIAMRCSVVAGGFAWMKYSLDNGTTYSDLGTTTETPKVTFDAVTGDNWCVGAYAPIVAAAQAPVRLQIWSFVATAGNVTSRNVQVECKP